jgi:O-antigen/teichoic acid export membrane protein
MGVTATERPRPTRSARQRIGRPADGRPPHRPDGEGKVADVRTAVRGAIPLALAGLFANAANVGVTVIIARELSTRAYGAVAQLLALYFVVSIPGSALLVGVVRRVSSWRQAGDTRRIGSWVRKVRQAGLVGVAAIALVGLLGRGLIARELSLPGPSGVAEMLTAGAAWSLLCIDRALLQCGGLYRALAANVCMEGLSRTVVTLGTVIVGFDQNGVALGQIAAVVCCVAHARWVIAQNKTAVLGGEVTTPAAAVTPRTASTATFASAATATATATATAATAAATASVTASAPATARVAAAAGPAARAAGTVPVPIEVGPGGLGPAGVAASATPDGPAVAVGSAALGGRAVRAGSTEEDPATRTPGAVGIAGTGSGPVTPLPSRRLAVEVGAALTALAFLGLLQNIDVLVLGRLKPGESGAYAAISVASKVLVFGAMVLAGFLLPEAANRRHLGQHALHQLGGTLAILAVPATLLLAASAAAPHALLSVAFGPRLTGASAALLPLAAAMTCLGATVLFTHYLLAVGSRQVLLVLAVAAFASFPMLVAADGHAVPTARADLLVQALLAGVTGLMVLSAARRTAARA